MNIAYEAMMFAREVHKDQRRKYTNEPYVLHLAEVAGIVSTVAYDITARDRCATIEMLAVAWLHDVIEDQNITFTQLADLFGFDVADGVRRLSDLEPGNRAERKAFARVRLSEAPAWVQTIKCADLISNTSSIVMHDPKFAVVYLEEKRLLLDVMTKADPRLLALARMQAGDSKEDGNGS